MRTIDTQDPRLPKVLEDLCALHTQTVRAAESGSEIYVGLEHIDNGRFFLRRHAEPSQFKSTSHRFRRGDILYGKLRPYLDKAVIAEAEGVCSTELLVLRPKNPSDSTFILSVLHSQDFIDYAQSSADKQYPRTSWNWISKFPVVSHSEQQRSLIGKSLENLQHAIEIESAKKERLEELFRAALAALISGRAQVAHSEVDVNLGSLLEGASV